MLHLVEDVHMQMFLGMILYFCSIFYLVKRTVADILQNFENVEHHLVDENFSDDPEKREFYLRCKKYFIHFTEPVFGIRQLEMENVYLEKYFQRIINEMLGQMVGFGFPCWLLVLFGTIISYYTLKLFIT